MMSEIKISLIDPSSEINIDPNFSSSVIDNFIGDDHFTLSNKMVRYKWGSYQEFHFNVDYIPNSDAQQINEWWQSQATVQVEYETVVYNVSFLNQSIPFSQLRQPYYDVYRGNVNFLVSSIN